MNEAGKADQADEQTLWAMVAWWHWGNMRLRGRQWFGRFHGCIHHRQLRLWSVHHGAILLDNRNGTFAVIGTQPPPARSAYVAAQRLASGSSIGLSAPVFSAPPSLADRWEDDSTVVEGDIFSDDNQGNGVADGNGNAADDEDDEDDDDDDDDEDVEMGEAVDDSDDDFPEQTIQIQLGFSVGQTPTDDGSSGTDGDPMDVDSNVGTPAAQSPVSAPVFPVSAAQAPAAQAPIASAAAVQAAIVPIWPYITRWTLYPLPLPSPSSPAHRTLLALLSFPRIRTLPVSWQERLRARTPSLGTLTAVALYLGGRAESGSPCQSHCGQYGALVERLFAVQREKAWEKGLGYWKFERKFAFPRCVKVPEALEGDREVEEVLGGRPCCNHFFRELRGAWETSEPFPPKPPGGLVWNGPMW
ncbi:hypothetical protein B0H65DRAFT_545508 [Neurospora tetraspora]|uniref:Uncharacterized protein n=1 Tax=Neurospora tetraspora TaxID=94610 RepID=A0AAE0JIR0_9PEZI|nr:hypothetical protein B0H65DRAFT_545508 [Neurospora tetraspora]